MRKLIPEWLAYFKPRFHLWQHEGRALIGSCDSEFSDAPMKVAA